MAKTKIKRSWRPSRFGAIHKRSAREAARLYLTRTHLSQTEIARRLHVTVPCVNQVAMELRS